MGQGWISSGYGTLSFFQERDDLEKGGRGRLKFVTASTMKVNLHAYIQSNNPLPMPVDSNPDFSRVVHLWSSTMDRNRTCFALTFYSSLAACMFDAEFDLSVRALKVSEEFHGVEAEKKKMMLTSFVMSKLLMAQGGRQLLLRSPRMSLGRRLSLTPPKSAA